MRKTIALAACGLIQCDGSTSRYRDQYQVDSDIPNAKQVGDGVFNSHSGSCESRCIFFLR